MRAKGFKSDRLYFLAGTYMIIKSLTSLSHFSFFEENRSKFYQILSLMSQSSPDVSKKKSRFKAPSKASGPEMNLLFFHDLLAALEYLWNVELSVDQLGRDLGFRLLCGS